MDKKLRKKIQEKVLRLFRLNQTGTFEEYEKEYGDWQPPHIYDIIRHAKDEKDVIRMLKNFY